MKKESVIGLVNDSTDSIFLNSNSNFISHQNFTLCYFILFMFNLFSNNKMNFFFFLKFNIILTIEIKKSRNINTIKLNQTRKCVVFLRS